MHAYMRKHIGTPSEFIVGLSTAMMEQEYSEVLEWLWDILSYKSRPLPFVSPSNNQYIVFPSTS